MPTIQSYEEATDYIYGGQAGSVTYWTIIESAGGGPYWYFTYTDVYGNPQKIGDVEGGDWTANLNDLNNSVSHLKPKIVEESPPLSPVIRKIRKLEARFKERVSA